MVRLALVAAATLVVAACGGQQQPSGTTVAVPSAPPFSTGSLAGIPLVPAAGLTMEVAPTSETFGSGATTAPGLPIHLRVVNSSSVPVLVGQEPTIMVRADDGWTSVACGGSGDPPDGGMADRAAICSPSAADARTLEAFGQLTAFPINWTLPVSSPPGTQFLILLPVWMGKAAEAQRAPVLGVGATIVRANGPSQ
jgi:hypothetical protein